MPRISLVLFWRLRQGWRRRRRWRNDAEAAGGGDHFVGKNADDDDEVNDADLLRVADVDVAQQL